MGADWWGSDRTTCRTTCRNRRGRRGAGCPDAGPRPARRASPRPHRERDPDPARARAPARAPALGRREQGSFGADRAVPQPIRDPAPAAKRGSGRAGRSRLAVLRPSAPRGGGARARSLPRASDLSAEGCAHRRLERRADLEDLLQLPAGRVLRRGDLGARASGLGAGPANGANPGGRARAGAGAGGRLQSRRERSVGLAARGERSAATLGRGGRRASLRREGRRLRPAPGSCRRRWAPAGRQTSARDHEPDRPEPVRADHAARGRLPGDPRQRGLRQDHGRAPPHRLPRLRRSGDRRTGDPRGRVFAGARALCGPRPAVARALARPDRDLPRLDPRRAAPAFPRPAGGAARGHPRDHPGDQAPLGPRPGPRAPGRPRPGPAHPRAGLRRLGERPDAAPPARRRLRRARAGPLLGARARPLRRVEPGPARGAGFGDGGERGPRRGPRSRGRRPPDAGLSAPRRRRRAAGAAGRATAPHRDRRGAGLRADRGARPARPDAERREHHAGRRHAAAADGAFGLLVVADVLPGARPRGRRDRDAARQLPLVGPGHAVRRVAARESAGGRRGPGDPGRTAGRAVPDDGSRRLCRAALGRAAGADGRGAARVGRDPDPQPGRQRRLLRRARARGPAAAAADPRGRVSLQAGHRESPRWPR